MTFVLPEAWQSKALMEQLRSLFRAKVPLPESDASLLRGIRYKSWHMASGERVLQGPPNDEIFDCYLESVLEVAQREGSTGYTIESVDALGHDNCIDIITSIRLVNPPKPGLAKL